MKIVSQIGCGQFILAEAPWAERRKFLGFQVLN
jgi:hypothetical protein